MSSSFAPGFLVAAPTLQCPFFHHTVVLLVEHGDEGSFGFVLNKPSIVDFDQVLGELDIEMADDMPEVPVMQGGPVSPETGWIVFDPRGAPQTPEDTVLITDELALTASLDMVRSIATGMAPQSSVMLLGYSGWGPGQLEEEMKEGSWIPVDVDPMILFAAEMEERWQTALRSLGIDPARVVSRSVAQA